MYKYYSFHGLTVLRFYFHLIEYANMCDGRLEPTSVIAFDVLYYLKLLYRIRQYNVYLLYYTECLDGFYLQHFLHNLLIADSFEFQKPEGYFLIFVYVHL